MLSILKIEIKTDAFILNDTTAIMKYKPVVMFATSY